MLKVQTIEQFKIMKFLNAQLDLNLMKVELVDRNAVKVTDSNNETLTFEYQNSSVVWG